MDGATSPTVGVHEICDAYVADYARLQNAAATEFGISGHDDDLPDSWPDGHRACVSGPVGKAKTVFTNPRDDRHEAHVCWHVGFSSRFSA
ncbi:hypothetical protein [Streptomyces sp. NBC_01669]|uniref:hypothetical protein n=1 Tax=Streptomyces sp. NBC_01669 TaxID=2975909 RepID=UPI00225AC0EB|nr:hypothetical protein [Streptomyces sp. NBC_01669]MCX4538572.1 hypothetical protein [Streptomyces sp. NBC_01669]